jgi:release factor glutamine methyltransferase
LVVATDNSPGALEVAAENLARTDLGDRVELVHGEFLAGLAGPFDLVVSNPPYVKPEEVDQLEPEVARFEPREALVAHGVTEAIAEQALPRLAPGAPLVLEVADGEACEVAALLTTNGYEDVRIGEDLAGRERVVDGRAPR